MKKQSSLKKLLSLLLASTAMVFGAEEKTAEAPAPKNTKIQLTLEEAQQLALKQNPSLLQAKAAIAAAEASVRQAWSKFYPNILLSGSVARQRDNGRLLQPYTSYNAGMYASVNLFNGFQDKFALLTAKYEERSAGEAELNARRLLLSAVTQAYYSCLLAQDSMRIAKEDADFNQVLLNDAQKRYEGGVAKQSEVLNFVLGVQKADVDYVTAEKNWKIALIGLGALLTINETSIWDNYELVYPKEVPQNNISLEQRISVAHELRPDLRSMNDKVVNARDALTAAKNLWYPTVDAALNYGFDRVQNAHFNKSSDRNISYNLQMSWEVFSGFETMAKISQQKANLVSVLHEREDLLLNIDSEVRTAQIAFETSLRQLEKQEVVLQTARQIRDLVHQEYVGGTTTVTRLNEAQTDMNNAESSRSAAFLQVLNSLDELLSATGENLK